LIFVATTNYGYIFIPISLSIYQPTYFMSYSIYFFVYIWFFKYLYLLRLFGFRSSTAI